MLQCQAASTRIVQLRAGRTCMLQCVRHQLRDDQ
jgi:hypothetical protein